jgi:hypothetical protein
LGGAHPSILGERGSAQFGWFSSMRQP